MGKQRRKGKKPEEYKENPYSDYMLFLKYDLKNKVQNDAGSEVLSPRKKPVKRTKDNTRQNVQTGLQKRAEMAVSSSVRTVPAEPIGNAVPAVKSADQIGQKSPDPADSVKREVPLSQKLSIGDRVINTNNASEHFGRKGTVTDILPDRSCDWQKLGVQYAPVIASVVLDTGNTIQVHEHFWFPVDR